MGAIDKAIKQNRKAKVVTLEEPVDTRGGFAIPGAKLKQLEAAFKADFSTVRIHQGEKVDNVLEQIGAQAFTQGEHIFAGSGGIKIDLLAHECVHVIQQREGTTLKGSQVAVGR
jgi:hypothetical protein